MSETNANDNTVDPVSPTVSNEEEITSEAIAPVVPPEMTLPLNATHQNRKRREPEGGFDRPPISPRGRRKTNDGRSSAEEELIRMSLEHLRMIEEEQESEPEGPVNGLEASFTELDLTVKPPSLMTRLAEKMLAIAEAKN
jgi:hypothetical protein